MTYQEFCLSRQLIAEERTGKAIRAAQAEEDSVWAASTKALQQMRQN